MNILIQCGILFGICIAGNCISALTHLPIPGNVFGMLILFSLLYAGVLKKAQIRRISKFLLGNMAFFFIPSGVAIIVYYKELGKVLVPFLLIIIFTTFIVMGVTGGSAQLMQKLFVRNSVYYRNKRNYSFVTKQGGWLYYSYSPSGLFKRFRSGLYIIKSNGTGKQKLTGDIPFCIDAVGKWIYYGCRTDSDTMHYALFKIRNDGTKRTRINHVHFNEMLIVGDWIYYTDSEDRALYRIRTDETQKEKLNSDRCRNIHFAGGAILYINCSDDGIYKIGSDGLAHMKICGDRVAQMVIAGGSIFYMNKLDGSTYRMKTDGSEKVKLVNNFSGLINTENCWIYYNTNSCLRINGVEANGCIMSQIHSVGPLSQKQSDYLDNGGIGIMENGRCSMIYRNICLPHFNLFNPNKIKIPFTSGQDDDLL